MHDDLAFALELADLADRVTLERFRATDLRVDRKPNLTLVSDADREVERRLRDRIERARPGESVLGEELGAAAESAARWIVDPIDGTHNFVRGIPVFATLIALEREGRLVASVASAPALGRRWWAAAGVGAFADGRPIRVSAIDAVQEATLSVADLFGPERPGLTERLAGLARRCWRTRGFGDFWQHCLVGEGAVEVVVEPDLALWDIAAVKLIVEEAGGRVTNLAGDPALRAGPVLSTNGLLHDEVLDALRDPQDEPRQPLI